jgi:hypothetical protein
MKVARKMVPLLAALAAMFFAFGAAFADDWKHTGTGIRVKTIAIVDVKVYEISHYVKQLPTSKSKQAVIELDAGKKFVWKMLRDVEQEKIKTALKDAYAMNGYGDAGKIGQFVGAFSGDLKEKQGVTITYDADKKATTIKVDGGGTATVAGVDFMKATWSVWFGKIDQPKLGDQLISKIP